MLDFTIETSMDLKKTNYLQNSQKFRGQQIWKNARFVFFGLEKAKPGNPDIKTVPRGTMYKFIS